MIPYGTQDISDIEIREVLEVLRSSNLTQGPAVKRFESELASFVGANYGCAVNSATSALHSACLALGVGVGDLVWTSPISFVASSNAALYCGATVDFVDIDADTFNLCPQKLEDKLKVAAGKNQLPKVVIPVHMGGLPCDMAKIWELSQKYGFKIVEDASHAVGAEYLSSRVGDCRYSDVTIFSFHPVKIITTGEGGMALTNSARLAERIWMFSSHGVTRDESCFSFPSEGGWYYEQQELGYNYRMTDIQAALGSAQLRRLEGFLARRREIAARYDEAFDGIPLKTQKASYGAISAWHLYLVQVPDGTGAQRQRLFNELRAMGIGVNVHYKPIHTQPYYLDLGFRCGDFPNSEHYYAKVLSLPIHTSLSSNDQSYIIDKLRGML